MNSLINLMFETGDSKYPVALSTVIVHGDFGTDNMGELEDSFSSYLETTDTSDKDYEDIIQDVLDAYGFTWEYANDPIPECKHLFSLMI